jgi:hypothetical protein
MSDIWATIATECGALATDLGGLTPSQWETPSLCAGWTVHDIVAHLSVNPPKFFLGMIKSGFNFDKFANGQIAQHRGADPAATLGGFRGLQNSTSAPPGPKTSSLGEVVIHGADVRRPLGIPHTYPPGAIREAIDFYKGSNLLTGSKNRVAGLALGQRRRMAARTGRADRGLAAVAAARDDRARRRLRRPRRARRADAPKQVYPNGLAAWYTHGYGDPGEPDAPASV